MSKAIPKRIRVIIEHADGAGQPHFSAAIIEGIGGGHLTVSTMFGPMTFSREDGSWLSGSCLNYEDGKIRGYSEVEESIKAGFFGDVAAYRDSLPKLKELAQ